MEKNEQLLEAVRTFQPHFIKLKFYHLTVFRPELRTWSDDVRDNVVKRLVASGELLDDDKGLRINN